MRLGGFLVLGAALVSLALWSYQRAGDFEQRAQAAEKLKKDKDREIEVLDGLISSLIKRTDARAQVIDQRAQVVRDTDAKNPPPDTCRVNIAPRDSLIADQAAQIADLATTRDAEIAARQKLQVSRDSLSAALGARPKGLLRLPFLEIGRPTPAAFIGLCDDGKLCKGFGVSIPFRIGGGQ